MSNRLHRTLPLAMASSLAVVALPSAMALDLNASVQALQALQQKAKDARDKLKDQANAVAGKVANAAPEAAAPAPAGLQAGAPVASEVADAEVVSQQMVWRIDGCARTQTQEVSCSISVASQTGDRRITLNTAYYSEVKYPDIRLIDSNGNEYRAAAGGFGINESNNPLILNGTPAHATFRFKGVDPGAAAAARFMVQARESRESVTWSNIPFSKVERQAMPQSPPNPTTAASPQPSRLSTLLDRPWAPTAAARPAPAQAPAPTPAPAPAAPTLATSTHEVPRIAAAPRAPVLPVAAAPAATAVPHPATVVANASPARPAPAIHPANAAPAPHAPPAAPVPHVQPAAPAASKALK